MMTLTESNDVAYHVIAIVRFTKHLRILQFRRCVDELLDAYFYNAESEQFKLCVENVAEIIATNKPQVNDSMYTNIQDHIVKLRLAVRKAER